MDASNKLKRCFEMATVIGYRRMTGTSKKTQQPYSGYLIFYTEPLTGRPGDSFQGDSADSAFVFDALLDGVTPYVGAALELSYDKRGFLREVILT